MLRSTSQVSISSGAFVPPSLARDLGEPFTFSLVCASTSATRDNRKWGCHAGRCWYFSHVKGLDLFWVLQQKSPTTLKGLRLSRIAKRTSQKDRFFRVLNSIASNHYTRTHR